VRAISNDPRFEALKKGEKKQVGLQPPSLLTLLPTDGRWLRTQVWNAWKGKRAKEEKEEARQKAREVRSKIYEVRPHELHSPRGSVP
jgi:hypothetical protein